MLRRLLRRRKTLLTGRVAVVTGGARGIGRATTEALLRAGCSVAIADCDALTARSAARDLSTEGRVLAYALDVTDLAAFKALVTRVEEELGHVDILINNAGIMPLGGFLDLDPSVDRAQIDVNLYGVINGMRAVLPGMVGRNRGHVVNIASVAGRIPVPHASVYAATKHAVIGLTESVRAEYDGTDLRFSYVMPALVDTELILGAGRPSFPPALTPKEVACGVLRALETGRVEVYLPGFSRISKILPALTPRAMYEPVGRFLGVDKMFSTVDDAARSTYRERILRRAKP
jgi:hypothetical protein